MFVRLLQAANHIQVWQSDVSILGDQDYNDIIFGWGWFGQSSHKTTTCKIVWQIFTCIALYFFLPVAKQHPNMYVWEHRVAKFSEGGTIWVRLIINPYQ